MGLGAAERPPTGAASSAWQTRGALYRKTGSSLPNSAAPLRAKLYTADLESGLHYLLRVELAAHRSLAGAQLKTFRDFVTIVAKVWVVLLRPWYWVPFSMG